MAGAYRARLTIGSVIMEQPFALIRDAAVILTDAELRQLNATRLTIARLQAGLRETQARPAVTLGVPHGASAETAADLLRTAFARYTFETRIVIDTPTE